MAVDRDTFALKRLAADILKIVPKSNLALYTTPEDALKYASVHTVDIVFLDYDFFSMSGFELAYRLKELHPRLNIIFTADTDDFAAEAFKLRASGYLRKPVGAEDIKAEFDHLRYPPKLMYQDEREWKLRIKCFGNFEVFGPDDNPLAFPRLRCKETLAYLVDRAGAGVTIRQIAAVIWDGREFDYNLQKQAQTVISAMMRTLKKVNADEAISKNRNNIAILPDKVNCDYYRLLKGDPNAFAPYAGEYMSQYSWSEFTNGDLWRLQSQAFRASEREDKKKLNFVEF